MISGIGRSRDAKVLVCKCFRSHALLPEGQPCLLHEPRRLLDTIRLEEGAFAIEIGFDELLVVVGERQRAEHLRPPERRVTFYERLDRDPLSMPRPQAANRHTRST